MKPLLLGLLMSLPALADPLPKALLGAWEVESMRCGGKAVPPAVAKHYQKPNRLRFYFEKEKSRSEWRSGKCRFEVFYSAQVSGPGKLQGNPTGQSSCDPENCLPHLCGKPIPQAIGITYGYRIKKKKMTITSVTGIECILQGLPAPAEISFRRAKAR
jgi:hypothetical protein